MSSACERRGCTRRVLILIASLVAVACSSFAQTNVQRVLKVAADPNNLPFSNERGEGFENKIAELVARDLNARVEYTWHAQRRGFLRQTLKERGIDVAFGVPQGSERALTTEPYYRSGYFFVQRKGVSAPFRSLDDSRLRTIRIGVQVVGDDGVNPPPVHALSDRGIVTNVVGFTVYGDYSEPNPAARIIDAVAAGAVDVAVVWGPLAGYFVKLQKTPLEMTVIEQDAAEAENLPFTYAICAGVNHSNKEFCATLNEVFKRRQQEINFILDEYGIPRIALNSAQATLEK